MWHQALVLQPTFMVGVHLRSGALVEVLPQYCSIELGVYAIYASRKHLTPKVRVLMDFLVEAFRMRTWDGPGGPTRRPCWTDGSIVIDFSSVNSSITARPSKWP
jgi:hypothetical protein